MKGARSKAFALERPTTEDYIKDYASKGYGIEDIKHKLWWYHDTVMSLDAIKAIAWRNRNGPA